MTRLSFIISMLLSLGINAQTVMTLAEFQANSNSSTGQSGAAGTYGVTATGITRGPGVTFASGTNFSSQGWSTDYYTINQTDYVQFGVSPISGFQVSLTHLMINFVRDAAGPKRIEVRSSLDNYSTAVYSDAAIGTSNNSASFSLGSQFQNLTSPVTFRIYGHRATSSTGILRSSAYSGYTKVLLPSGALAGVVIKGTKLQLPTPANDNCQNAISLPVNSVCTNTTGSNVGATPSTPAPTGGCPSAGNKDTWYQFTMPNVSNPQVTIRTTPGSLTDGVMEVYTGTSCNNMTLITCEDDNSNGNGSTMPVINLQGGPGATVWIRIWGYSGTTGTFNICLLNYQSVNFVGEGGSEETIVNLSVDRQDKALDLNGNTTLLISPNPASEIVNVTFPSKYSKGSQRLILYNTSGKIVMDKNFESIAADATQQLDVSNLSSGCYFLNLVTTDGVISEKLIISGK